MASSELDSAVPHYFFHLASDDTYSVDEEGAAFVDLDEAYLDAYRAVLDMGLDMLKRRQDPSLYRFEIADAAGTILMDLLFSEVLKPRGRRLAVSPSAGLHATVREGLARSKALREEVTIQIIAARETLARTKSILAKPIQDIV